MVAHREIDLADLRPDPHVEAELRWYYNVAAGEMGMRSGFASMVARIEVGARTSSEPSTEMNPRFVEAASRARLIKKALDQLGEADRRVLLEAYREQVLVDAHGREALQQLAAWGAVAALVALSAEAQHKYRASRTTRPYLEWLARLARPTAAGAARTICSALRREAETRLARAGRAYAAAARQVRRARRAPPEPGQE